MPFFAKEDILNEVVKKYFDMKIKSHPVRM